MKFSSGTLFLAAVASIPRLVDAFVKGVNQVLPYYKIIDPELLLNIFTKPWGNNQVCICIAKPGC